MKILPCSFISKQLDRILAGSVFSQVRMLIVTYCVILLAGWLVAKSMNIDVLGTNSCDPFWWAFVHTMDPGFLGNEAGHSEWRLLSVALSLAGFLLLGGLFVSVLVNTYERRMRRARQGLARYTFKKDHGIILGWDRMGPATVHHLLSEGCREVVVLTMSEAEKVRNALTTFSAFDAKELRKKTRHVFIFHGSFDAVEELRNLRPWAARKVVILGDPQVRGSNSRNLQTAMRIAEMVSKASPGTPSGLLGCQVAISHLRTYDLLQEIDLSEEDRQFLDFRPFNFYEGWARKVWSRLPDARHPHPPYPPLLYSRRAPGANVVVAILGFGQMGQAMALQAARLANHANNQDAEIVVFDPDLGTRRTAFEMQHGLVDGRLPGVRFVFHEAAADAPEARELLTGLALDEKKILTVVICLSDPDQSMSTALGLPPEVLIGEIPILVRQEVTAGLSEFARRLQEQTAVSVTTREKDRQVEAPDTRWDNIRFFGSLDEYLLDDAQQERLARSIHQVYLNTLQANGWMDRNKPAQKPWERLSEKYRWSNRYQADAYLERLRSNGFSLAAAEADTDNATFTDEQIETMAEQEHNRWWVERVLAGWEKGPRDDLRLTHPDMIPFDELSEKTKEFDRDMQRTLPKLLKESCGLSITS
ncbi:Ryanodine receptor Ryr [Pseudodesulfovibrio mercurii]|uniref:Ryanodine receptor Ryr n=1 Tax=Pseudodesulfovibrio mercurii TaxID=641491 RepID=F0JBS0_9BACT|nr:RyR domain-containing protein [Pseudodesulfovibrio mercurii]EGB15573.1 Ryanodine receptor Ryr [Pseudodesulfovibrio mercurii]